jgi:hypothetical protein
MTIKQILENVSEGQGWNGNTQRDLLIAFIENLEFLLHADEEVTHEAILSTFSDWIANKAEWENHGD